MSYSSSAQQHSSWALDLGHPKLFGKQVFYFSEIQVKQNDQKLKEKLSMMLRKNPCCLFENEQ